MKYVAAALLIFILGISGILNPIKNFFLVFFTPIQFGLSKSAFVIKDFSTFFAGANEIRNSNLALLERNYALEQKILELKHFEEENTLLKTQLSVKNSDDTYKLIPAALFGDIDDVSGGIVILDKGSKDGIATGNMVIVGDFLIGTIKNVDYTRSRVELVTSSHLSYTVYDIDSANKTSGLAIGKHGSTIGMERILPTEDLKVGDTIVTLGKEGLFLPGYAIGKVVTVAEDPTQPLKSAEIKTVLDFSKLTKVFVLVTK